MGLAFIYPTSLVVYAQKSDFHMINLFCAVIVVKKCRLLCLAQAVFSYCVLHSSKILYLWCLRPRLHICAACCSASQMELIVQLEESILGGVPKQSSAVSGLWMLTVASMQALVYIC